MNNKKKPPAPMLLHPYPGQETILQFVVAIRPYGMLVVRSSLLAKWLLKGMGYRDRVRVRAGAREYNTSFFSLSLLS